ncbi:hypothetical protein LTR94_033025, partial [Friedmanniomyces endolithicus]
RERPDQRPARGGLPFRRPAGGPVRRGHAPGSGDRGAAAQPDGPVSGRRPLWPVLALPAPDAARRPQRRLCRGRGRSRLEADPPRQRHLRRRRRDARPVDAPAGAAALAGRLEGRAGHQRPDGAALLAARRLSLRERPQHSGRQRGQAGRRASVDAGEGRRA